MCPHQWLHPSNCPFCVVDRLNGALSSLVTLYGELERAHVEALAELRTLRRKKRPRGRPRKSV